MITEVSSKQQLEAIALELRNKFNQLGTDVSSIISTINGVSDYDGINISQASSTLANNLQTITNSLNSVITGINSYSQQVNTTDVYDLNNEVSYNSFLNNTNSNTNSYVDNSNYNDTNSGYNENVSDSSSYNSNNYVGVSNNSNSNEVVNSGKRSEKVVITMGDDSYQVLGNYTNNSSLGFNVTKGNFAYQLTDADFNLLCAIVASEGNLTYDESLAVVSTILNRCDNGEFISMFGKDPIAQITGLNQFASYSNGSYKSFLNNTPIEVVNAVKDALSGVRNHNFCSYKANSVIDFSNNMITSSGNRYK